MHPVRTRFRAPAPLAVAAGAALLLVAAASIRDSPLRKEQGSSVPVSGVAAPVAPLSAAAPVSAPAPTPAPAPAPAPAPTHAPGSAGMVVGIDPETGKLGMPSPEFRARASLSPALDRSMTGLTVVVRPDGSKHLDLQGRFQEYVVIRLTPDGRKVETCVQGPDVDAALSGKAPPAGDAPLRPNASPAPPPAPEAKDAPAPAHELR